MALKNPTPPTPPTPPVIDKGDGENNHAKIDAKQLLGIRKDNSADNEENNSEEVEVFTEKNSDTEKTSEPVKKVTTPETMARDAVATGAGALTKKTVEKPEQKNSQPEQKQSQLPPSLNFAMTEDDRGKAILKEFQQEEKISDKNQNTSKESPRIVKLNQHEGYGGIYWIVTLILAVVLGFLFVKKFLVTDKPKLKKSDLFTSSQEKLKATAKNFEPPVKPVKPVKLPPKPDEDKGKHFEVRI